MARERVMEEVTTDVKVDRMEKRRGGGAILRDGIPRIWGNSNG